VRIWSLHPQYLDAKGLTALWRESLLARKVLMGATQGYTHHPQLERFRFCSQPLELLNFYLAEVYREATQRRYSFDSSKFRPSDVTQTLTVTEGQLAFEVDHLKDKLFKSDPTPGYRSLNMRETILEGGAER
jgi:hypothetical protein